jgi:hypothetical protein
MKGTIRLIILGAIIGCVLGYSYTKENSIRRTETAQQ